MKTLVWLLLLLALAVALSLSAQISAGFVILVYPPWRIELSLSLFAVLTLAAFVGVHLLLRLISITLALPARVRAFRAARRAEKGSTALREGFKAFFEGRYGRAERRALSAAEQGTEPGLARLLAARATHEMKAYARRDRHLAEADRIAPDDTVARLMTRAELLLNQRRHEEALDALRELNRLVSNHTAAIRLELKAQQQAQRWDKVPELVARLEKRDAIDAASAEQIKIHAHIENLRRQEFDLDELRQYWKKIRSADRLDNKIAMAAARCFMRKGDCRQAVEIITDSLEKNWDSELVKLYGLCGDGERLKQIERAEKWLRQRPHDAALLLALGRLCAGEALWGKAQSYLEASLSVEPLAETHLALAQLHEKMQRNDEACRHYRHSLALVEPRSV